jgi:5'-3' exonuclease
MLPEQKDRLLIVDSMALLFRGFFATSQFGPLMQTKEGLYTNAIYQFTKYLMDAVKKYQPTHIVCAQDMGKETFRNKLYPFYKANRGEPPLELIPQFSLLGPLTDAFNIPLIGVVGYEADDIIGTLAQMMASPAMDVSILTGDGDTLQLLDEHTSVIMMKKGMGNYEDFHLHNFTEKKRLAHPKQVIDLKGLMGDTSDNIPGCPNVGPKTAEKLLLQYGDIEGIYNNIADIKGKLQERLLENKDQVLLSRQLATIDLNVPIEVSCSDFACNFNKEKIHSTFKELEFQSLLRLLA